MTQNPKTQKTQILFLHKIAKNWKWRKNGQKLSYNTYLRVTFISKQSLEQCTAL